MLALISFLSIPQPNAKSDASTARKQQFGAARLKAGRMLRWLLGAAVLAHLLYGGVFWLYSLPRDDVPPFADDFEQGDLRRWDRLGWKQLCCAHSMQVVADPANPAGHVVRAELRRNDPLMRGSRRAEMRLPSARDGALYRYAVSVFLPVDWVADPLPVNLVQWHSVSDKILLEGSPTMPLRLVVVDNRWVVDNNYDSKWVTKWPFRPEVFDGGRLLHDSPLDRGRWVSWEFHVRWDWREIGSVQVFKDGRLVGQAKGPMGYRDLVAPYMKFGVYVPAWADPARPSALERRVAYFDNIVFEQR